MIKKKILTIDDVEMNLTVYKLAVEDMEYSMKTQSNPVKSPLRHLKYSIS